MATFLEKNKKKNLLALLLLFIRERRAVFALVVVVACASFLFVSPSSLILRFPGGARVVAGMAWVAGELGMDTEQWGLPEGKRNFKDLLAAFRAAKAGGGKAGWSTFMRGAGAAASGDALGEGSLGFVSGRLKDLEGSGGAGAKIGKARTVAGILNPGEAGKMGEGDVVSLSRGDLAGERAGWLRRAFTEGFSGRGSVGGANLSGGAYAGAGFFGGSGRSEAGSTLGDQVGAGLAGLSSVQPPRGTAIQGAAKGKLSSSKASAIAARTSRGVSATRALSRDRAYVQLATGNGLAKVAVAPDCAAPGCPAEFGATNTGAIYDGNAITGAGTDILTAPSIDGVDAPNMPNSGLADGYIRDAERMEADAKRCEALDSTYGPTETSLMDQQASLVAQVQRETANMTAQCGNANISAWTSILCFAKLSSKCNKIKMCKGMAQNIQNLTQQAMDACTQFVGIRCQHTRECPLTQAAPCTDRCS